MSLVSVPAVFDGKDIKFLEPPPVDGPYRVLVTFVEPTPGRSTAERDASRFWASFGSWQDDRSTEEIIKSIHVE